MSQKHESSDDRKENEKEKRKRKKQQQIKFETAVKKLRDHKKNEKEAILKATSHFYYGKDPQKYNSLLGKRKFLQRLCARDIYDDLKEYIDDQMKFHYCLKSCCFNTDDFTFELSNRFNLSEQLMQVLECKSNNDNFVEGALIRDLICEKNKGCILKINDMKFYVKTIKQNALSSAMEPRQNSNRMSYGPVIFVSISDNILMKLQCDPFIGVGYCDLPNHKINKENGDTCSYSHDDECIHRMVHIHEEYIKEIYIAFGFKQPDNTVIDAKLLSKKLPITLFRGNMASNINGAYGSHHQQSFKSSVYRYSPIKL